MVAALLSLTLLAAPLSWAEDREDENDEPRSVQTDTVGVTTNTAPPLRLPERKETFSVEILGRGGAYSLTFDKMVGRDVALGLGVAYYTVDGLNHSASMLVVPAYANYYFNDDSSRAFITAGVSAISASEAIDEFGFTGGGLGATAGLGYEFRGARGGLFRLAPYVLYSRGKVAFTAGLTIGNAFF